MKHHPQHSFTLIGMPTAGKSTLGKAAASALGYTFTDIDSLISQSTHTSIAKLVEKVGEAKFQKIEETTILDIQDFTQTIIATGGSAIYSEAAMAHLKAHTGIIYLKDSLDNISNRIAQSKNRGIIWHNTTSIEGLYNDRIPYYEKYAEYTFELGHGPFNKNNLVQRFVDFIQNLT